MKRILSPIFYMLLAVLIYGCSGGDRTENGRYENDEYHFRLNFPTSWRIISEDEAIKCSRIRAMKGLDNRLHITPSNPDDAAMVVSVLAITQEQFNAVPWDRFKEAFQRMGDAEIVVDTVEDIGGFVVHRLGGFSRGYYAEVALFLSEGRLMQINYWVKQPDENDIRSDMEGIVKSLRRI